MGDVKKSYFTTGQMRNALLQIEDQMVHSNWMPGIILSINRGGCIPGVYLSHRLKIPHEVLDIRLRDHKTKPDIRTLEKAFSWQKKILIITSLKLSMTKMWQWSLIQIMYQLKMHLLIYCNQY